MCPIDFSVDEKVVQDRSTEDEERTVEVLKGWLVDDGRQDEVAGNQAEQNRQNNRYLQGSKEQQTKNMSSKNPPGLDCDTHPNWSVEVFSGEAHDYESQPRHTIKPPLGKTEVVDERADVGGNNVANS